MVTLKNYDAKTHSSPIVTSPQSHIFTIFVPKKSQPITRRTLHFFFAAFVCLQLNIVQFDLFGCYCFFSYFCYCAFFPLLLHYFNGRHKYKLMLSNMLIECNIYVGACSLKLNFFFFPSKQILWIEKQQHTKNCNNNIIETVIPFRLCVSCAYSNK